ncbi:unnamed protein product [Cylicocyclus nassatus]|uniref:Uncharacterized protein n=1 Tax=Cylicocyclus nassatus TaxID=53992 RepID=A0AA36M9G7_CYLNA|nr:unnamed protein product [Cylicocyclus nassatus]
MFCRLVSEVRTRDEPAKRGVVFLNGETKFRQGVSVSHTTKLWAKRCSLNDERYSRKINTMLRPVDVVTCDFPPMPIGDMDEI